VFLKIFLVSKINKIKNLKLKQYNLCFIDINLWFKTNNLNFSLMNEVREYIFEEWFTKKIIESKNKIITKESLYIIYENPTPLFIEFLKEKISSIFPDCFYEIVFYD